MLQKRNVIILILRHEQQTFAMHKAFKKQQSLTLGTDCFKKARIEQEARVKGDSKIKKKCYS